MRALGVGVAALSLSVALHAGGAQAPKTDTNAIVRAATEYLDRYQREFASLVAEEDYVQTAFVAWTRKPTIRRIRGELFLAYLPADRTWIAVHDVAEPSLDGPPKKEGHLRSEIE